MKNRNAILLACALLFAFGAAACSKPRLYGTNQASEPVVQYIGVSPADAYKAAKEALVTRGYAVQQEDEKAMTLETYWQPTTADSHYVLVFGEPDYGTVGAYYRLAVKVTPQGSGSKVSVTNVAKSFISDVRSSKREEDELLAKISDFTRKRDIQVTNIGLQ